MLPSAVKGGRLFWDSRGFREGPSDRWVDALGRLNPLDKLEAGIADRKSAYPLGPYPIQYFLPESTCCGVRSSPETTHFETLR